MRRLKVHISTLQPSLQEEMALAGLNVESWLAPVAGKSALNNPGRLREKYASLGIKVVGLGPQLVGYNIENNGYPKPEYQYATLQIGEAQTGIYTEVLFEVSGKHGLAWSRCM
jgi:hypothetical protein